MESLNGYIGVIAIVGFIAVIALAAFLIAGQRRLLKNIAAAKFAVNAFEEVGAESGARSYAFIVSNRSLSDVRVSAFGIISGVKHFDFTERFNAANEAGGAVTPRTPVKLNLATEELEKLVFSSLAGGRFKTVKTYVIDSAGNACEQRAVFLEKALKAAYKKYLVRFNAAKKARAAYDSARAAYEFAESVRARGGKGERVPLKDKLKAFLLKNRALCANVEAAKARCMRAERMAGFYTEESAARAAAEETEKAVAEESPAADVCADAAPAEEKEVSAPEESGGAEEACAAEEISPCGGETAVESADKEVSAADAAAESELPAEETEGGEAENADAGAEVAGEERASEHGAPEEEAESAPAKKKEEQFA